MTVSFIAILLWLGGAFFGFQRRTQLAIVALFWISSIGAHLVLGPQNPLRVMLGGDVRIWTAVGLLLMIILGYRAALHKLKSQALRAVPIKNDNFGPDELDRYARHIMLREIGGQGQNQLKSARVLVIGAGGLGAPALMYLAAAGVGTIGIIDDDVVDTSNLQRQIIHSGQNVGLPKVQSAKIALHALNPHVTVLPYHRRLDADSMALISEYDLILDGSDNFETRYAVNAACVAANKPLISGAITQWEGQVSLFHPAAGAPCYACVFPQRPAAGLAPSCAEAGVLGPLPGVIGAMMAAEAVKYFVQTGASLANRLLIYDALYAEVRVIKTAKIPSCTVCGGPI